MRKVASVSRVTVKARKGQPVNVQLARPSETGRPARYSSTLMERRRQRVLEQAGELVAKFGYDKVTMRDLAKASGVAPATLYNVYGSKERLIAKSVSEHFASLFHGRAEMSSASPLELALQGVDTTSADILRVPKYAAAMVAVYFSHSSDSAVRDRLRSIPSGRYRVLLSKMQARKEIFSWVDLHLLADGIANQLYAGVHDWAIGRVSSQHLADRQKLSFLLIVGSIATAKISPLVRSEMQSVQRRLASTRG